MTELNSSGWKITKEINGKHNKSPNCYNNKQKPFVRNGLPPVILKTAQCFYKQKASVKDSQSDEFIIEKPKQFKGSFQRGVNKRSSATHLLDYPPDEEPNVRLYFINCIAS